MTWSAASDNVFPAGKMARQALARHLEPRLGCGLAEYYADAWTAIDDHPDPDAVEAFLRRVPFF